MNLESCTTLALHTAAAMLLGAALACAPALAAPAGSGTRPAPASTGAGKHATPAQPAAAGSQAGSRGASQSGKKPAEQPDTVVLSDTLNYNDAKKESVFTGSVVMTRGLMTLRADKLALHQDAEGFQYGTATVGPGKLVFVRQENPEKFEVIEARGLRAEYDGKTEEFEMIGKAVVTRFICGKPFDTISGERVKYNQKTDIYQAYGGPNSAAAGGRVRSVAQPGAKADAAVAECSKKSAQGTGRATGKQ
ncbi:lipopolysaccharide transport periplasmic protein LptA [Candidimonas nitroreducens]|nr:lipopolysaccharide transport periplasmic protein LptA [Candidimonas nitroreducens]